MIAFLCGVVLLQQQASLPSHSLAFLLASVFASVLLLGRRAAIARFLLLTAALSAGFFYAAWRAELQQSAPLDPSLWRRDVVVTGVVEGLVSRLYSDEEGDALGMERFNFRVEGAVLPAGVKDAAGVVTEDDRPITLPALIRVSLYQNTFPEGLPDIRSGERWRLRLRLTPPYGNANPYTFDYQRWLFAAGIGATASARGEVERLAPAPFSIDGLRSDLRDRITTFLPNGKSRDVLIALVIGEQNAISQGDWNLFNRVGISHLMAISGLHITMVGAFLALIAGALWRRGRIAGYGLPLLLPVMGVRLLTLFAGALLYSLIAGFEIPAQRTVLMLGAIVLAYFLKRNLAAFTALGLALFAVLLLHPWAVLDAGFWLSFAAVMVLVYWGRLDLPQALLRSGSRWQRWRRLLWLGLRWQMVVIVGLATTTLFLFSQMSLLSPVANAMAIPLVSYGVIPLAFCALLLPDALAAPLLQAAGSLLDILHGFLLWLVEQAPFSVWQTPQLPLWLSLWGLGFTLLLLLPWRAGYWRISVLALIPVLFWPASHPAPGAFAATFLDVGQGTAVLVETAHHRLLFDTGPRYSAHSNAGERIVLPYLKGRGIDGLDSVIVSHNDSDHSGGALPLLDAGIKVGTWYVGIDEEGSVMSKLAAKGQPLPTPCIAGQSWHWDGVDFSFLHPAEAAYSEGEKPNRLSCALRIANGPHRLLLLADNEAEDEAQLIEVARQAGLGLEGSVLLVPHHGSKTSSTEELLAATTPPLAIVQAGFLNRYRHPHPTVVERYREQAIPLLETQKEGAIGVVFPAHCWQQASCFSVSRFKREHWRYWWGRPPEDEGAGRD